MPQLSSDARARREQARGNGTIGGQFGHQQHSAPAGDLETASPYEAMTPFDVDTELNDVLDKLSTAEQARAFALRQVDVIQHSDERLRYGMTRAQRLERAQAKVNDARAIIEPMRAQIDAIDEEHARRGRWPRAFVVPQGHVHSSLGCSTCYPTTRFQLLPEYSDKTETELVEDAGDRACTVCFPSAPVDRPTKMELPEERQAREARQVQTQERDEKKLAAAAKAITTPDGEPLKVGAWASRWPQTIKTERAAMTEAKSQLRSVGTVLYISAQDDCSTEHRQKMLAHSEGHGADFGRLVDAIAARQDKTPDEVVAEFAGRWRKDKEFREMTEDLAGQPIPGTDLTWPDALTLTSLTAAPERSDVTPA
ncbi:hypothetical protein [Pseudoclavibacter sp. VKM Ac-2888]|uniref:hypothetical protein n=1 Tax=Pseudoclavibacter sp. VKM Ac-2888 TaxID=2783830 RepID=UPI00188D6118|nr:hypothetical protein [Pseudoclavibacter sp. VKM Ac-2888]MBF4549308.1 hypothetical protein [Pseudoclavibacter sp. VKM Ac-2888]